VFVLSLDPGDHPGDEKEGWRVHPQPRIDDASGQLGAQYDLDLTAGKCMARGWIWDGSGSGAHALGHLALG
jgi:hypothetical protein